MRKAFILMAMIVVMCGCNIQNENLLKRKINNKNAEAVEASSVPVSNKTVAWGFRRMNNGTRPEFSESYIKPLEQYNAIYVGDSNEKYIYLTFDEGYENGYTASILDTLKKKGVTATFFVTMPYVKQNPDLIKRMIDEGHIVRKS